MYSGEGLDLTSTAISSIVGTARIANPASYMARLNQSVLLEQASNAVK